MRRTMAAAELAVLVALLAAVSAGKLPANPIKFCNSLKVCTSSVFKMKNGQFKMMQVADVHFQNGDNTTNCKDLTAEQKLWPCSDVNSTDFMAGVLDRETPNLVVFSGDNLVHDNRNATDAQIKLTKPIRERYVPWMITFGNHDCESDPCQKSLIAADRTSAWSHTQYSLNGQKGAANYAYLVVNATNQPVWVVYVIDGGAYYQFDGKYGGYDWINAQQVQWYNTTSIAIQQKYGRKIPAVMFFHIPIPEYDIAMACGQGGKKDAVPNMSFGDFGSSAFCPSYDPACLGSYPNATTESGAGARINTGCSVAEANYIGVQQEGVYSAHVNGGLFAALRWRGDVKMVNVGHDHVNDFCSSVLGIRLCYGGGFGYHAYNTPGFPRRSRQIVLYENGTIATWHRLDGSIGGWGTEGFHMF